MPKDQWKATNQRKAIRLGEMIDRSKFAKRKQTTIRQCSKCNRQQLDSMQGVCVCVCGGRMVLLPA